MSSAFTELLIQNCQKQELNKVQVQYVTAAQMHSVQRNWKLHYTLPLHYRSKKDHVLAHLFLAETHFWKYVNFIFFIRVHRNFYKTNLKNFSNVFM